LRAGEEEAFALMSSSFNGFGSGLRAFLLYLKIFKMKILKRSLVKISGLNEMNCYI
jgi:hypothetical protein